MENGFEMGFVELFDWTLDYFFINILSFCAFLCILQLKYLLKVGEFWDKFYMIMLS